MKQLFQKFIAEQGNDLSVQIFRYLIAGGLAFALDFTVLAVLVEIVNVHYLLAVAIAFCCGLVVTYVLNRVWVFAYRKYDFSREFSIFTIIAVTALGLTELIIWFFTEVVDVHYLVSKAIAVILVFAASFYLRRKLLFSADQNLQTK